MLHRCNVREWEWEGMGIDCTGMGGSGNVKSHSRASLTRTLFHDILWHRWRTSVAQLWAVYRVRVLLMQVRSLKRMKLITYWQQSAILLTDQIPSVVSAIVAAQLSVYISLNRSSNIVKIFVIFILTANLLLVWIVLLYWSLIQFFL